MQQRPGYQTRWTAALVLIGLAIPLVAQEAPRISVGVAKDQVYVGEPFIYTIQVDNASDATPADLAALTDDFLVEYGGGKQNNSEIRNYVNGQFTRVVKRQYLMYFRLTARRTGTLQIPAFEVQVGSDTFTTNPVIIRATKPVPVEDFKLVCTLSKDTCYAGEPITMTTTFYIARNMRSFSFSLPILDSNLFHAEPVPIPQRSDREYFTFPVNGEEVKAEKNDARVDGKQFVTLTFKHVLVPREAGEVTVPDGTVSIEAVSNTRSRRRSLLDDFSLFRSPDDYETVIAPANPLALTVLPVPEAGKPDNFSGLIGAFNLTASASPTDVNMGDPITLTINLEGSFYLRHFELPPLATQPALAKDFTIPDVMAPGRAEGNRKIFTQTIRANSATVSEIPPIELAYFDTTSGTYKSVASDAIPLTVRATKVLTADDAEGHTPVANGVTHVAVNEGIAHNYTEGDALKNQYYGPNVWMHTAGSWLLLILPPALWSLLAGARFLKRTGGIRFEGRARKQARPRLEETLDAIGPEDDVYNRSLEALREYLGARLGRNASAMTYADARVGLEAEGVGEESLTALKDIFDACEAHRYAGGTATPAVTADFTNRVKECVRAIDKEIQ